MDYRFLSPKQRRVERKNGKGNPGKPMDHLYKQLTVTGNTSGSSSPPTD